MRSGDPDDVEPGAQVWSTTHQDPRGWVGGVVLSVDRVARTCEVLPNVGRAGPQPVTLSLDELNMEATKFDTGNAGVAATQLWAWLATLTTKERRQRARASHWAEVATRMQALQDAGTWLPGTESRYQRSRLER